MLKPLLIILVKHNGIAQVNYAGLASHPDHSTAMKQMKHPGGIDEL
jgi:cystathionine beta-lyase/cystathionine gamma-synthase